MVPKISRHFSEESILLRMRNRFLSVDSCEMHPIIILFKNVTQLDLSEFYSCSSLKQLLLEIMMLLFYLMVIVRKFQNLPRACYCSKIEGVVLFPFTFQESGQYQESLAVSELQLWLPTQITRKLELSLLQTQKLLYNNVQLLRNTANA